MRFSVWILLRILLLAFDQISALYFTPFTVKYFADDAIPSSLISRVLFYVPSLGPSIVRYEYEILMRTLLLLMHIQRQCNA